VRGVTDVIRTADGGKQTRITSLLLNRPFEYNANAKTLEGPGTIADKEVSGGTLVR